MVELKYDMTPENGAVFAADVVEMVQKIRKVRLDYSIKSLKVIDEILEDFREDGVKVEDVAATLFSFGCYVGEVFVRNAEAEWREATRKEVKEVFGVKLVLDMQDGKTINPIGKVIKRLRDGEEHSLAYYYKAITK